MDCNLLTVFCIEVLITLVLLILIILGIVACLIYNYFFKK